MAILVTCEACKQTFRVRDEYLDKKAWCPACRAPITLTGERVPNHEVFISYSNKDKHVADAICAKLEALPLRCWIAPRDVAAGHSWGSSIIEAIEEAKVMVLVYSGNSNLSPQVIREVERAVSKGLVLVPFRIEATMMSKDMEYFLSSSHWIDALTPPLEQHLVELGELVRTVLFRKEKEAAAAQKPTPAKPTEPAKPVTTATAPANPASQPKSRYKLWIAAAVALVAIVGMAGWWFRTKGVASRDTLPPNLRDGLILYYDFDSEPVAGKVVDKSGHGNNGTSVNVQFVKDGHQGGAASFGLTQSYITVKNKDELNPPHLTLAAWIKTSYFDNVWRRIIDKQSNHGFALSIGGAYTGEGKETSPKWKGRATSEINRNIFASDAVMTDGRWHHVVTTFNGLRQNLYVDGIVQQEGLVWNGFVEANEHDITIGGNRSNPYPLLDEVDASFNGEMDDVMMFNRALSADEVQTLFKSQGVNLNATSLASTPAAVAPVSAPQPGQPWINSLGMKFVPVPGTTVLFSIWDTRVQDYQAFVTATGRAWPKPDFEQGPTHPAVMVSWDDAKAFCAWLTQKERQAGTLNASQEYRLPTDLEWSTAVGLEKETGNTPKERSGKIKDVYPWGTEWPPPHGAGNYESKLNVDDFANTSPVGSFAANRFGLYDTGGNVWQWCEDFHNGQSGNRVLRGGSWLHVSSVFLLSSSCRFAYDSNVRVANLGFRCVLAKAGTGAANPATSSNQ